MATQTTAPLSSLPIEVKDLLREFAIGYSLELCPIDVIDFGVQYFTRLQLNRTEHKRVTTTGIVLDLETLAQKNISRQTIPDESTRNRKSTKSTCCIVSMERIAAFVLRLGDSVLFRSLDTFDRRKLIQTMSPIVLNRNDFVYEAGEIDDTFYMIEQGELSVSSNDGRIAQNLSTHECIGELALLYSYPRYTTVQVVSATASLWTLSRDDYRNFMIALARENMQLFEKCLRAIPILTHLTEPERYNVTRAMSVIRFKAGERMYADVDLRNGIHYIVEGKVSLRMRETCAGGYLMVAIFGPGDFIGELSLITVSTHLVMAFAETNVKLVYLCMNGFGRLFGKGIELIRRTTNVWMDAGQNNNEKNVPCDCLLVSHSINWSILYYSFGGVFTVLPALVFHSSMVQWKLRQIRWEETRRCELNDKLNETHTSQRINWFFAHIFLTLSMSLPLSLASSLSPFSDFFCPSDPI